MINGELMLVYEVGKPFPGLSMPAQDTWQYLYRQDQHELIGLIARPTMEEAADIRRGRAEFALYTEGDLLVLCCRFGSQPWSDALYSWHLVPEGQRTLPETDAPQERRLLTVVLVDRASGRIATNIRMVSFSPEFTAALHAAIREQSARPWPGPADYDRQIADLYRRYPDTEMLVRDARARCVGGQP